MWSVTSAQSEGRTNAWQLANFLSPKGGGRDAWGVWHACSSCPHQLFVRQYAGSCPLANVLCINPVHTHWALHWPFLNCFTLVAITNFLSSESGNSLPLPLFFFFFFPGRVLKDHLALFCQDRHNSMMAVARMLAHRSKWGALGNSAMVWFLPLSGFHTKYD